MLKRLDEVTRGEPALNQRVKDIRPFIPGKLKELKETIDLHRSGDTARADRQRNHTRNGGEPATAGDVSNHTKLILRDGQKVFIDDSAAPIRNEAGTIIGAVLVFRDISERRRSEERLEQSALALQRSNEELQQFAFAASHDLRSPLRSNTMAQFGDKLGDEGNRMIGYISDGASRMTRLIDDLLALARETSAGDEPKQFTSVESAQEAARGSLSADIEATGVHLRCQWWPHEYARRSRAAEHHGERTQNTKVPARPESMCPRNGVFRSGSSQ